MQLNYSSFYDFNSSFISNGAFFGGSIYILSSNAIFNQSRFVNNYGNYGGTLYVTGNSTVIFDNVTISGSTSFYDGGLIYADDSSGYDVISFSF